MANPKRHIGSKPRPAFNFLGLFYSCGDQEVHLIVSAQPLLQEDLFIDVGESPGFIHDPRQESWYDCPVIIVCQLPVLTPRPSRVVNASSRASSMNGKPVRRIDIGFVLCFLMFFPLLAQQEDSSLRDELDALKQGQEQIQRQIRLMREIEALKRGQSEIKKELEEIRKLVQQRPVAAAPSVPAGPNVKDKLFDLGKNPIKGNASAKLTGSATIFL